MIYKTLVIFLIISGLAMIYAGNTEQSYASHDEQYFDIRVTDILVESDHVTDKYTFTIKVSNIDMFSLYVDYIDLEVYNNDTYQYDTLQNKCSYDAFLVESGNDLTFEACFYVYDDNQEPVSLFIGVADDVLDFFDVYLPFTQDEYDWCITYTDMVCLHVQSIENLTSHEISEYNIPIDTQYDNTDKKLLDVKVTHVMAEHGYSEDKYTFTVKITNNDSQTAYVTGTDLEVYGDGYFDYISDSCNYDDFGYGEDIVSLRAGEDITFETCHYVSSNQDILSLYVYVEYDYDYIQIYLPFTEGDYSWCLTDSYSVCMPFQSIDNLIKHKILESDPPPRALDINANVIDVSQNYTLYVNVTNTGFGPVYASLGSFGTRDIYGEFRVFQNNCGYTEGPIERVMPGGAAILEGCYDIPKIDAPFYLAINEFNDDNTALSKVALLPFSEGITSACKDNAYPYDTDICLPMQTIDSLMPHYNAATSDGTSLHVEKIDIVAASYHSKLGYLVVTFSDDVTLLADWQNNIILHDNTVNGTINVVLDDYTKNYLPNDTNTVWIQVPFPDRGELKEVSNLYVIVEPNTFLDGDGNPNQYGITANVLLTQ